jgi:hypothetical protein
MGADSITFLATIPPLQSAIQIHGGGDGMRVKLEIPESEMANAVELLTMREAVLKVTVAVDDDGYTRESKRIQF